MKVWAAIFNLIAVLILLLLGISYFNLTATLERDFDQIRLNYAVEYATEAMFETTLESEDLDMDYTNLDKVQIDSSDALDIFCSLICFSYDMSLSEENFINIENSIASCVLAGSDGFYIGQMADYDSTPNDGILADSKRLRWSMKFPYFVKVGNYSYSVGYNDGQWKRVTKSTNTSDIKSSKVYVPSDVGYPMGINDIDVKHAVNSQIRDAMLREIKANNLNKTGFDFKFYLPDNTTVNGVNPVEPPAVLLIMEGVDFASTERINALSVAGFKVVKRVNVVAFVDKKTGRHYYCYESQLLDEEKDACCGGNGSYHIENYYRDIRTAAESKGLGSNEYYSPYYDIMARKITKN